MSKKFFAIATFAFAFAIAASAGAVYQSDIFTAESGYLKVGSGMGAKMSQMSHVIAAQTALNACVPGSNLKLDGKFGPLTKGVFMSFQASKGIKVDGVIGPVTAAQLAACSGTTTPTPVSTTGSEGSVTVTYDATPSDNLSVLKGETKNVMGIKIKATGSDMNVSRVWLDINTRIWLSADTATLLDGSTVIATLPLTASTVTELTAGSAYQMQFNNLNYVVPVGQTKVLTLRINRPELTSASASATVATTSTIRTTDGKGITSTSTLPSSRTINLSSSSSATTGTLTATLNANSPIAQSVSGLSTTAGTLTDIKLMDFDLKSKDGSINVTAIGGTLTSTGTIAEDVASVELRDGSTVLASVTGAGTFSFTSLGDKINIDKDTTKTLSIYAKVNHIASSYVVKGDGINAAVTSVTATSGANFTSASITPTVTGKIQYLFQYAPTFAVVSSSASQVEGSAVGKKAGNYSVTLNVTAPAGSDIYVNATDGALCGGTYPVTKIGNVACSSTTIGGTMATGAVVVSGTSSKGSGTLATWDKISAGTSRTFTVTGYVPDGNAAGFTGLTFATNGIQWTDTDNVTIVGTATIEQTWGVTDFKSATTYVTA